MKWEEIIDTIQMLARSQGLYGRLLNAIDRLDKEDREKLKAEWEAQNFKDPVDFVLYIEC